MGEMDTSQYQTWETMADTRNYKALSLDDQVMRPARARRTRNKGKGRSTGWLMDRDDLGDNLVD
ncbi:hypothetical protein EYZ11_005102 [Aspergillus tanneri]|uniref:Uncharacterized protein n=1 Tax=Aspergillus tanneri TaxID=1220188 RepID=A0A4S3JJF3_9EURO|nr:hypothetical protein EYZ11_005102 [Aspergillus tanneri]